MIDSISAVGFRIKFQLAKVLSHRLVLRNAVSPRSFMSSTMDTDALHESSTSKDYSSEHIQVISCSDDLFLFFHRDNVLLLQLLAFPAMNLSSSFTFMYISL